MSAGFLQRGDGAVDRLAGGYRKKHENEPIGANLQFVQYNLLECRFLIDNGSFAAGRYAVGG
jgi:hypothetical protein